MIATRDIADHPTVIGVHVMYGDPKILKAVTAKNIVFARVYENSIPTIADAVILDNGARSIPYLNTIATLVHSKITPPDDLVAFE